jgi:zinc D-Ala-D-Ala carboxypeptidase
MKLSPHFTLRELTASGTASRLGIDNSPGEAELANLRRLCETALEPLRELVGKPISVNSGLRVPALNKAIGGSSTSAHVRGLAADIEVRGLANLELARIVESSSIPFDQCILEFYSPTDPAAGWVHVGLSEGAPRGQVLTASKENGRTVYRTGLPE